MPPRVKVDRLTAVQAAFCLEYEANGRNATQAYLATHPNCTSRQAAAVEGMRTLRIPHVASALHRLRKERAERLTMQADEAAMLVGMSARADIRLAFDSEGKPLPPHQWPDELAKAVKALKADGTIVLHDQLDARKTVLQMHGKLKTTVDVNHFDHVGYLASKQRASTGGAPNADTSQDTAESSRRDHAEREGQQQGRRAARR